MYFQKGEGKPNPNQPVHGVGQTPFPIETHSHTNEDSSSNSVFGVFNSKTFCSCTHIPEQNHLTADSSQRLEGSSISFSHQRCSVEAAARPSRSQPWFPSELTTLRPPALSKGQQASVGRMVDFSQAAPFFAGVIKRKSLSTFHVLQFLVAPSGRNKRERRAERKRVLWTPPSPPLHSDSGSVSLGFSRTTVGITQWSCL